jgi:hypothetical protein
MACNKNSKSINKVKELDDEEAYHASLEEPLYRVETGNYEYRQEYFFSSTLTFNHTIVVNQIQKERHFSKTLKRKKQIP